MLILLLFSKTDILFYLGFSRIWADFYMKVCTASAKLDNIYYEPFSHLATDDPRKIKKKLFVSINFDSHRQIQHSLFSKRFQPTVRGGSRDIFNKSTFQPS